MKMPARNVRQKAGFMSVCDPERARGVGEIFDRAIDLVVRNAVVSIGLGCAFELTGALIEDGGLRCSVVRHSS
jgi:hypothetical protein